MTAQWLPRPGDKMILIDADGQPVTSWYVELCTPVIGPDRFTLVVSPAAGEGSTAVAS